MKVEHDSGVRPLYRPRDWQAEERRINKKKKKNNWSSKGGYIAPIMVPSTPGGELCNILKEVAEMEAKDGGMKFKVVEKGGRSVQREVQKSNPTATPGCSSDDCPACQGGRGDGGNCRKSNVQYEMECLECPETNPTVYVGETARNVYTRGLERFDIYRRRQRGG